MRGHEGPAEDAVRAACIAPTAGRTIPMPGLVSALLVACLAHNAFEFKATRGAPTASDTQRPRSHEELREINDQQNGGSGDIAQSIRRPNEPRSNSRKPT